MRSERGMRRYLVVLGLCVFLSFAFWGTSYLILHLVGETLRPSQAAAEVAAKGGRYGSVLRYRPFPYKMALQKLEPREVLVVGSSRVMMFRQEFFSRPMLNFGGSASSVESLRHVVDEILANGRPRFMLIGLDHWWFNGLRRDDQGLEELPDIAPVSVSDMLQPVQWIAKGELSLRRLAELVASGGAEPPGVGYGAKFRHTGFGADGSYFYGYVTYGGVASDDRGFKRSLRRSNGREAKFSADFPFNEAAFAALRESVERLRAEGVDFMLVLPPVAEPVQDSYAKRGRGGIAALVSRIEGMGWPLADFTDPRPLDSPACEFVDGMHGGVVTYSRLSLELVRRRPDLAPHFDLDWLRRAIERRAGHASMAEDLPPGRREVDFLALGCHKV